jgi:hypothetical protein
MALSALSHGFPRPAFIVTVVIVNMGICYLETDFGAMRHHQHSIVTIIAWDGVVTVPVLASCTARGVQLRFTAG